MQNEASQPLDASCADVFDRGQPLPVRMLNEYAYCPRLFFLMHVDGRWDNNAFTEEGRAVHARPDAVDTPLPEPASSAVAADSDQAPVVSRSVSLTSATLGLTGKLDLVEKSAGEAVPVDFKRGHPPKNPERCYEPERVQLMAQALLLREHAYTCRTGCLYFAGAKRRVEVSMTAELEQRTLALLAQARALTHTTVIPPPLDDSPKCHGCSLSAICLPDETNLLNLGVRAAAEAAICLPDVRRLYPAQDHALPLYLQEQGARVGKTGESLQVTKSAEKLGRFPLKDVSQLVLCGNVGVTAQAIHLLCESEIPIVHLSSGGWFYGVTRGHGLRNAYDRAAQFATAADETRCVAFARAIVEAKARNQRTLLRRNAENAPVLEDMARLIKHVPDAPTCQSLLGIEGSLAARYFAAMAAMIDQPDLAAGFDANGRNRRPPHDPVNALLSYGYALLAKECTVALLAEGLDPWWGLYHRPRHGRPALALDLMEEFRPLIVDSAVITAINNGMVTPAGFATGANGCLMKPAARKSFIQAYEQRLDHMITHPFFRYRCSWRTVIRLQARLLARWLRGDIPTYQGITTR